MSPLSEIAALWHFALVYLNNYIVYGQNLNYNTGCGWLVYRQRTDSTFTPFSCAGRPLFAVALGHDAYGPCRSRFYYRLQKWEEAWRWRRTEEKECRE